MQIFQSEQNLLRDHLHKSGGNTRLLVPLNERKEVLAKRLEHDTDVDALRSTVLKGVEEGDNMVASRMPRARVHHLAEQLDLVTRCLGVAPGGFDHLEGGVAVCSASGSQYSGAPNI